MKITVETVVRAKLDEGLGCLEQPGGHQAVEYRPG
jgi:hypothetical protein